jgi:hypothetical protein
MSPSVGAAIFLLFWYLTGKGLYEDFCSFFCISGDTSAPSAAVAVVKTFKRKNARIGLKSKPKIGGLQKGRKCEISAYRAAFPKYQNTKLTSNLGKDSSKDR